MNRTESIKLLKNVVEDFKEEKEFVGRDLIEAIECLLNELDKKDKVIHFMANSLTTDYHDIEWVEEYFYKLVEGNIDKKQTK